MNLLNPGVVDTTNLQQELSVCGVRTYFTNNPNKTTNSHYQRFNTCGAPTTKIVHVHHQDDFFEVFYGCDELAQMLQEDSVGRNRLVSVSEYANKT